MLANLPGDLPGSIGAMPHSELLLLAAWCVAGYFALRRRPPKHSKKRKSPWPWLDGR